MLHYMCVRNITTVHYTIAVVLFPDVSACRRSSKTALLLLLLLFLHPLTSASLLPYLGYFSCPYIRHSYIHQSLQKVGVFVILLISDVCKPSGSRSSVWTSENVSSPVQTVLTTLLKEHKVSIKKISKSRLGQSQLKTLYLLLICTMNLFPDDWCQPVRVGNPTPVI